MTDNLTAKSESQTGSQNATVLRQRRCLGDVYETAKQKKQILVSSVIRGSRGGTTPPDWPSLWLQESLPAPLPPPLTWAPLLVVETQASLW